MVDCSPMVDCCPMVVDMPYVPDNKVPFQRIAVSL